MPDLSPFVFLLLLVAVGGLAFFGFGWLFPAPPKGAAQPPRFAPAPHLADAAAQVAYLADALASGDPRLATLAVKEVATVRRIPCALDEDPPVGELMRALETLGLTLAVAPLAGR